MEGVREPFIASGTLSTGGSGSTFAVVLNAASGPARAGISAESAQEAFQALGLQADIISLTKNSDLPGLVRSGAYRAIVAAGGDGTVNAVAAAVAGTEVPLGVIPAGTFNHFARDAGIPLDLPAAIEVIAGGHTLSIDVGEVNGRIFINNSSLGLYPAIVLDRERLINRGLPKFLAMALASFAALRRLPNLTLRVQPGCAGKLVRTPLLFVGNNQYEFSGLEAGTRGRLDEGCLQVSIVRDLRGAALVKLSLLALMGRLENVREFSCETHATVRVETLRRQIRVAVDGELVMMKSPLLYTVRRGALRVLAPGRAT